MKIKHLIFALSIVLPGLAIGVNKSNGCVSHLGELVGPRVVQALDPLVHAALKRILTQTKQESPVPIFYDFDGEMEAIVAEERIFSKQLPNPEAAGVESLYDKTDEIQKKTATKWLTLRVKISGNEKIKIIQEQNAPNRVFSSLERTTIHQHRKTIAAFRLKTRLGVYPNEEAEFVICKTQHGNMFGINIPKILGPASSLNDVQPESLSEATASEFLFGHLDLAVGNNYGIKNNKIGIYDYEDAFVAGVPYLNGETTLDEPKMMGAHLPQKYTRKFIENLKKLDEGSLQSLVGGCLTPNEIKALSFRRTIILNDAEFRGESALFP